MAEFICTRTCTAVIDGHHTYVTAGRVVEADKSPGKYFEQVGESPVDFNTDTEEALLAKNWKISDMQAWANEKHGTDVPIPPGLVSKSDAVTRLVYFRQNESTAAEKAAQQTNS